MIAVTVAMLSYFKRHGWIFRGSTPREPSREQRPATNDATRP